MNLTLTPLQFFKGRFNNISFKSNKTSSTTLKADTITISKEAKEKSKLAKNISQNASIDIKKAQKMVQKLYKSDKYNDLMQNQESLEKIFTRKLTPEEIIVYINYNLEYPIETFEPLKKISPLNLAKFLDWGMNVYQAYYAHEIEQNSNKENLEIIFKKYEYFLNLVSKHKDKFSLNTLSKKQNLYQFLAELSKDSSKFDELKQYCKKDNIAQSDILCALYYLQRTQPNKNFDTKDIREIIKFHKATKNIREDAFFESAIEEMIYNFENKKKTPNYVYYILTAKCHISDSEAREYSNNKIIQQNLKKIKKLITKDKNGQPKSGLYRILTLKEALCVTENKFSSKEANKFIKLIDYKGLDTQEALEKLVK